MGKGGPNMKWDADRERRLWLAIIQEMAPSMSSVNWDNVNDRLGIDECTAAACKKKLENTKTKLGLWGGGEGKTPTKSPGSKKRKASNDEDDGDDRDTKAKKTHKGDDDDEKEKPKFKKCDLGINSQDND